MKKAVRSFLSGSVALAILFAASGCSGHSQEQKSTSASAEPTTITMFVRNQSKYTGYQNDPVAKEIEKKLGIRIKLTVDSSLGGNTAQTSTFDQLLETKLASNDLDDIMDFGSPSGNPGVINDLNKAVEAGMIVPLNDLVTKYAKNLATDPRLVIRNEYHSKYMYPDSGGKYYSVAGWGGMGLDQLPGSANWVRWDLYKQLDYPVVHTDDDFLSLLQQMEKLAPKTPNGDKIYALGGAFADPEGMGDGFVNRDYPLTKGYESLSGNYAVYIDHGARELVAPLLDTNSFFWNGVRLYYKANKMGLLDPGSMSMTGSQYNEKVGKGDYLASLNGWGVENKEGVLQSVGINDSGYMPLKPLDDVHSLTTYWESIAGTNEFAISKACKNPDKAIELLDWFMSDEGSRELTQGAEGAAWEKTSGAPKMTAEYTKDMTGGTVDLAEKYGEWKYAGLNAFQNIDIDKSDGYYIAPQQIPDPSAYSAVKKDALSYYGAKSFTDYFTTLKMPDGQKLPNIVWSTYTVGIGALPEEIKQKNASINDYMYKAVFKMVYASSDAQYNELQQETMQKVKELGLEDVAKWYQNRWSVLRKELDPLIDEAMKAYNVKD